ncbi:phage tail tape measure protein [Rodentibacter trehalosifermentans]|uniref:Phage tail tape measure protein n=1 Tax=Rodentibacter trehalosifermentans TaxID=1908263 RepID=A0A1V3IUD8_9PAST|nr:phage tail tape measure protein [Rodentibacter trehalosifermentans]OOF45784.1 phage tail tape measure protein [Rodentibacter trehalosifermentans]
MNNLQLTVLLNAIDKISAPVKNASKSVQAFSEQIKNSKSALRDLEKVQNQMKSFSRTTENIKKSTETIDKHAKKLDNLRNKISKMKNERVNLKGKIKDAELYHASLISKGNVTSALAVRVKIAGLTKQYEKLQSEIGETGRKISKENTEWKASRREKAKQLLQLRDLKRKLKGIGVDTKNFAQHESSLAEKIKVANNALEKQQRHLDKLNAKQAAYNKYRGQVESLKNISGKAQMIGAQSMAAGATITAPIANVTKDFMSFEDAMLGVARQVPGVKDELGNLTPKFDEWKKKIYQMSLELPKNTVELANMVESAARMGVAENEIEDFIRKNVAMTVAFDVQEGQGDEFTEKMGRVRENLKLTQEKANALADTINYLDDQNLSKGTEIIDFLNEAAGISNLAKMNEKDLAAWGSTLITAGNEAGKSAKAFGSILTRLGSDKKPVKKALAAIGLNPDDVKKGLQINATETILKVFERVKKKVPEHLRLTVLENLAGGDYNKVFANLVANPDMLRKQLEQANSDAAKGSMDREFQTRMKALSASTQIFNNQLYNLKATIGGVISPTLQKVMEKLGSIVDKANDWIQANPELARKILVVAGAIGTTLTAFGALSLALSFVLYPMARFILAAGKLNLLIPKATKHIISAGGALVRGLLMPLKLIGGLFSSFGGWVLIALAIAIYKYWQPIKAFFSGFFEGLKSDLAPVIEKFKPLGDLFGVVVGWIEKAVKWFTDLLSPVQSTRDDLDAAASAGKKFGEWLAAGIDLVTKPLQWVMDSIKWVVDNMPSVDKIATTLVSKEHAAQLEKTANLANYMGMEEFIPTPPKVPNVNKWSGGYAGNGGKYEPKGIFHGGEYVMTKEATSRLGIHTLNALNYGKQALIAGGLGVSVATAAPVQVDHRPPISARPVATQAAQPMNVQITINAAQGMDERMIAQQVAKELQRIQKQQQARARSSLRDRV